MNKRILLARRPEGQPTSADFRIDELPVPAPKEGELLLHILFLSLDPYMRGIMNPGKSYTPPVEIGEVMEGGTVAEVVESRHKDFTRGEIVLSYSGWQSYAISDGKNLRKLDPAAAPVSTALGVLGMPGFTAYAGLLNLGRPKPGETVVVAAASGAVGSAVGQIARIKGARAVGIAGGADKCAFVLKELGFDAAVDHHARDFAERLKEVCPKGIDVYFENVGGHVWDAVFPLLNQFARIPVCGLIAQYSWVYRYRLGQAAPSLLRRNGAMGSRRPSALSRRHRRGAGESTGGVHRPVAGTQFWQATSAGRQWCRLILTLDAESVPRCCHTQRIALLFVRG
jgi:NADPH-dependent curcumin reductase CurA